MQHSRSGYSVKKSWAKSQTSLEIQCGTCLHSLHFLQKEMALALLGCRMVVSAFAGEVKPDILEIGQQEMVAEMLGLQILAMEEPVNQVSSRLVVAFAGIKYNYGCPVFVNILSGRSCRIDQIFPSLSICSQSTRRFCRECLSIIAHTSKMGSIVTSRLLSFVLWLTCSL